MKRLLKASVLTAAVAATTLAAMPAANADHWRRDGFSHSHVYKKHIYKKKDRDGDLLAAGIVGLAVGAIAAGVMSQAPRSERVYIDPPRPAPVPRYRYYSDYEPAPTYYEAPEPWSRAWYRACDARYRSFDPQSGTFMGYDGRRHFCDLG